MIDGFRVETSSFNMSKSNIESQNKNSVSNIDGSKKIDDDNDLSWLLAPFRG
jgi:hypothetical protein